MSEEERPDLATMLASFESRRVEVCVTAASRQADLPLRYWRQQAHLTAPADPVMGRKALLGGTAPTGRMMERLDVEPAALADRLDVDRSHIEALLEHPRPAPLVMLDAEDALAPTEEAAHRGREAAVEVLSLAHESDDHRSLRFFRPPGLESDATARELLPVLWGLAERAGAGAETFPLDGVVLPKVDHPEEVALVAQLLTEAEAALGLPVGRIRLALMVESGWAVSQLEQLVLAAPDRLCALIFGLADYSADLGLPAIRNDHQAATWARARIVSVAAAVGVPAIDGMTLDYPVADRTLGVDANRERFLDRMALVYQDAVAAREAGMLGKWVGHPAQLFAVLLADEVGLSAERLEEEASKLAAYAEAQGTGVGVTIIGGVMADRATDRHARVVLRQAVASGRFDPTRARQLGVIDEAELAELPSASGE